MAYCVVCLDIGDREQLRSLMSELKILIHVGSHLNILNLLGAVTKEISLGLWHLAALHSLVFIALIALLYDICK